MSSEMEKRENAPLAVPSAGELAAAFDGDKGLNVPVGAVLPVVKILRESPKFEMPDSNMVDSFRGHILYYHSVNQLYLNEYGAETSGQRPDCSSFDGLTPCSGGFNMYSLNYEEVVKIVEQTNGPVSLKDVDPSHPLVQTYLNKIAKYPPAGMEVNLPVTARSEVCASCPASQFGSKVIEDNSKACTNYIWLYILIDGYQLPVFLKVGPASLSKKDSLIPFLSNAPNIGLSGMYQTISIQFSLATKSFASGFSASSLKLSDSKVLDDRNQDDVEKLHCLIDMYKSFKVKYLEEMQRFVAEDTDNDTKPVNTEDAAF